MQLLSFVRMSFIKLWECVVHGPYIISGNIYIYIMREREREREIISFIGSSGKAWRFNLL